MSGELRAGGQAPGADGPPQPRPEADGDPIVSAGTPGSPGRPESPGNPGSAGTASTAGSSTQGAQASDPARVARAGEAPGRSTTPDPQAILSSQELTPWQQYVLLLRQLDVERAGEEGRTATRRDDTSSTTAQLERLGPRVIDQGAELGEVAAKLGLRRPQLPAIPPAEEASGETLTPSQLAEAAQAALRRSELAAREAMEFGRRAAFLPRWPARARNALIYLGWAFVGLVFQYAAVAANSSGSALVVLVIIPLITYSCALFMVGSVGRVRLSGQPVQRSARMGAMICFGLFPLGVFYLVLRGMGILT